MRFHDGEPTRFGVAVTDIVTGLYSTIGILAALLAKDPAKRPSLRTVLTWPVLESAAKLLPQALIMISANYRLRIAMISANR